jgi:UDP-N-acetylmuramoylalanine--D-glutamate ligase
MTDRASGLDLKDRAVTVIGLGRFGGGVGVTKWLASRGARVTVSDKDSPDRLAGSIRALEGLDVALHLGGHREEDFLRADLLIVNPAVPRTMPLLAAALRAGVPCTTEINLFLRQCPAPVVGITGSAGKSTTTAMTGAMLAMRLPTHVGGNIGGSLLDELPRIEAGHAVVLELSSFQLDDLPRLAMSPRVAVVTNLAPNHLDRHGTMEAYAAAKKNIFRFQKPGDVLILNANDPIVSKWAGEAPGRVEFFPGRGVAQAARFELSVTGEHNQANAQAAWAAARQFGVSREEAAEALRAYGALPHRLQFVAERGGVRYYNDSKCTTPEGAIVAMESFEPGRIVIILGGYDKGAGFDALAESAVRRAKAVVALGATGEKIIAAISAARSRSAGGGGADCGSTPALERAGDFASAVAMARRHASPGDVVLLSPACASTDMFLNYEERGQRFAELVKGEYP